MHYIIDGYNVIGRLTRSPPGLTEDLEESRKRLVRLLERLRGPHLGNRITVVFDGRSGVVPEYPDLGPIEVVFTKKPGGADQRIVAMVQGSAPSEQVCVVTDDRLLRTRVQAHGAHAIPVRDLNKKIGHHHTGGGEKSEKPSPDSPEGREITHELEELFGINHQA